jgi:hypothetical protein
LELVQNLASCSKTKKLLHFWGELKSLEMFGYAMSWGMNSHNSISKSMTCIVGDSCYIYIILLLSKLQSDLNQFRDPKVWISLFFKVPNKRLWTCRPPKNQINPSLKHWSLVEGVIFVFWSILREYGRQTDRSYNPSNNNKL